MATAYPYVISITDTANFVTFISKTFATITSATNDGTTVNLIFSAALSGGQQTALTTLVGTYTNPASAPDVANVSLYNSTSTALTGAAVFTGSWEDVSTYTSLTVAINTDQAGSLAIQYGFTSQAANYTKTYAVSASTPTVKFNSVGARWMRIVYTNGASAQTTFSLQTKWSSRVQQLPVMGGTETLDDTNDYLTTKSVWMGKNDKGNYLFARVDEDNRLRTRPKASVFGHVTAVPPTLVVQANFTYNLNTAVISTALTGSGAVTQSSSQALVSSGAAATSSATLSTRRYARSLPGQTIRAVFGCVFTTGVANNTQICGVGYAVNGLFFGYNAAAFGVMYRSNSVDTWVAKTAWNVDKLDGTGPSGITLLPATGNLYAIEYDASGYGTVTWYVSCPGGTTSPVAVHRVDFGNSLTTPGILNASLPCMASSVNTTNTSAIIVRVSNFAAFVDGDIQNVGNRAAAETSKTVTTNTYVPIMTVRNKATYNSVSNTSGVFLTSISICNNGNRVSTIAIYDGPTLTGASYADASTNTSCVDVDKTATAFTGGVLVWSTSMGVVNDQVIDLRPYNIYIPPSGFMMIASKCLTNGSNAMSISVNWQEDA